jgi:hypothetical protein
MFAWRALMDSSSKTDRPDRLFGEAARASELWRQTAAAGARVPTDPRAPAAGRAFAELPDPFEPLAVIEASGYATLEWIGTGRALGAVMLICPAA